MDNRKECFIFAEMEVCENILFQLKMSLCSSERILPVRNKNGRVVFRESV
jgi:hypothetical protein